MPTHVSILAWENPMDRGAWWATVHGVTKSQTCLSDGACVLKFSEEHNTVSTLMSYKRKLRLREVMEQISHSLKSLSLMKLCLEPRFFHPKVCAILT